MLQELAAPAVLVSAVSWPALAYATFECLRCSLASALTSALRHAGAAVSVMYKAAREEAAQHASLRNLCFQQVTAQLAACLQNSG